MSIKIIALLIIFSLFAGCGKKNDKTETKPEEKKENLTQQVQTNPETDISEPQTDSLNKSAGNQKINNGTIKVTEDEKKYLKDSKGQWAYDADASSTRANLNDDYDAGYSTIKLIGKPDVEAYGDNKNAWVPNSKNDKIEWFKVIFQKEVNATEVRIRQTLNPGTITKIELFDNRGINYVIWEGKDSNNYKKNSIEYFTVSFPKTDFKTKTVKVTIAANSEKGVSEFDAVQLVGE